MKRVRGRLITTLTLGLAGAIAAAVPAYATGGLDLRVEAASAHGKVGDTVPVYLKVIDPGPGGTYTGEVTLHYTAPGGTELADDFSADPACHVVTAGHDVWCYLTAELWPMDPALTQPFPIHLKIVSANVTPGQFKIECARDTNAANNAAAIVVNVDGVTPAPTATAAPSPRRSSAVAAPVLPVTGTGVGLISGVGAALLGAGIAFLIIARRRTVSVRWTQDR